MASHPHQFDNPLTDAHPRWQDFGQASARFFGLTLPVISLALMLGYILG